ncbi:hypothetical protein HMPREF9080_02190 [Cardiobacterium valvarum F0432]|uniref:Uncharacterized protein n=1 Tax=Cardiobacterium valvarum F0432 TaxID=797473 RepID=G9ZHG0_9GAMM|nr:hypothetical protein HMPREF9080_02190 [Cardiobacterium valvarum F0432]
MFVLEADGFLRIVYHPARKENGAMEKAVAEVDDEADIRAGRLGPGDFVAVTTHPGDIDALIFDPAVADDAAMDAVIECLCVFDVDFVVPAVVVGINQVFTEQAAQIVFIKSCHGFFLGLDGAGMIAALLLGKNATIAK